LVDLLTQSYPGSDGTQQGKKREMLPYLYGAKNGYYTVFFLLRDMQLAQVFVIITFI